MSNDEIIEFLTDSDMQYINHNNNGLELLESYIKYGFKGYSNYTELELIIEYNQRKLIESV
jgi:hypothetical protein